MPMAPLMPRQFLLCKLGCYGSCDMCDASRPESMWPLVIGALAVFLHHMHLANLCCPKEGFLSCTRACPWANKAHAATQHGNFAKAEGEW